jgi:hypothetical protein
MMSVRIAREKRKRATKQAAGENHKSWQQLPDREFCSLAFMYLGCREC